MKKTFVILMLLISDMLYAQNDIHNNEFQPKIVNTIELYGLTNYHICDEQDDYLNVKIPYGSEAMLGLELYQKNGILSFRIGIGRNNFNYDNSKVNRDNIISNVSLNIGYQYYISTKLSVGAKFGLYDSYKVITNKYTAEQNLDKSSYRDDIYAIDMGIGLEYILNKILTMRFEPYFNYTITNVATRGEFNEDLVFSPIIGIKLGLKFTIIEF